MEDLSLVGGRTALDFANSEGAERNGPPERIGSYGDLVAWSLRAGVIDAELGARLGEAACARPGEADRVFGRAIVLREALYRIFAALAAGRTAAEADRDVLDRELAEALPRRRLVPARGRFQWRFDTRGDPLDVPLWHVVEDAADLLSSDALDRVKECRGERCTWLFLDESRNRSRRWCDMGECGNRAKARRYRRRHGG